MYRPLPAYMILQEDLIGAYKKPEAKLLQAFYYFAPFVRCSTRRFSSYSFQVIQIWLALNMEE